MISIIGAGPIGNYLAYLLAKNNQEVQVFEEHKEIGKPVQCTGILTNYLNDIIKINKIFLVNKINKIKIYSPDLKSSEFKLKKPNFVIDRTKFDNYLADKAIKSGAKIYLNSKFLDYKTNYIKIRTKNKIKTFKTNYLIGADGPNSSVSRICGFKGKREFLLGMQARLKGNFDKDTFSNYFGNIAPEFFAWIVPENEYTARVGLATNINTKSYFDKFIKDKGKVIDKQASLIPIYNPKLETEKNNISLVGDAALQVKASTGGGIIPGLLAAQELSKSIINKEYYEKNWKKKIGKDLYISLLIRKALNKFSDEDYNELIRLSNKSLKMIIENYDREFPSKSLLKAFIKEPRLIKFIKKVI